MKREEIKPFAWGMGIGAIVLLMVVFSAGWVVTSGSSQVKAKAMVATAVMNRLAPISVAQFMLDPDKDEHLDELKELGARERGEYVEKQGWATMPGEKGPDTMVAAECARRLVALRISDPLL